MASAMRLVALMRDAISALIAGDQRVLIGSPARFTTPSHPEMAAGHRDGSAKAMVPLEKLPRNAARAFSTSRVSTTTSLPPASSFATRRVPTNPLAPEIATRIFPEEEEAADEEEEEEGEAEEASPARATCARPRRAAGGARRGTRRRRATIAKTWRRVVRSPSNRGRTRASRTRRGRGARRCVGDRSCCHARSLIARGAARDARRDRARRERDRGHLYRALGAGPGLASSVGRSHPACVPV